jgi:hypothetical protein
MHKSVPVQLRMYTGTLEKSVPVTLWTVHKNSLWTETEPEDVLSNQITKARKPILKCFCGYYYQTFFLISRKFIKLKATKRWKMYLWPVPTIWRPCIEY